MLGLPASGKSNAVAAPLARAHGALIVDADLAKERLPEYANGIGANAVHEESSMIIREVFDRAVTRGDNLVVALIGTGLDSLRRRIDILEAGGYDVHLHYVDLPAKAAIERAVSRFRETGRFVDPHLILSIGDAPRRNFETLKVEGRGRTYVEYSNLVPKGQPARIVAGGRIAGGAADEHANHRRVGRDRGPLLRRGGPASDRPDEGRGPPAAAQDVTRVFTAGGRAIDFFSSLPGLTRQSRADVWITGSRRFAPARR